MDAWLKLAVIGLSAMFLAAIAGPQARANKSDEACTLPASLCAKEGFIIIGPNAERLIKWRKRSDHEPIKANRAFRYLERAAATQTFTLLLGSEDVTSDRFDALIAAIMARGGAVIVTKPSLGDAERLNEATSVSGAAWDDQEEPLLYGVRNVGHEMAFVLFAEAKLFWSWWCRNCLTDGETDWLLKRIGREPPVVLRDPTVDSETYCGSEPESCINRLALAQHTSAKGSQNSDSQEIDNYIYGARSLSTGEDYYYISQTGSYVVPTAYPPTTFVGTIENTAEEITLSNKQTSPDDQSGENITTSVNFYVEGTAGYLAQDGSYQTAPNLAYSESATTSYSYLDDAEATNLSDSQSGVTEWQLESDSLYSAVFSFDTKWIWSVNAENYTGDTFPFVSKQTITTFNNPTPFAMSLTSNVVQPF